MHSKAKQSAAKKKTTTAKLRQYSAKRYTYKETQKSIAKRDTDQHGTFKQSKALQSSATPHTATHLGTAK